VIGRAGVHRPGAGVVAQSAEASARADHQRQIGGQSREDPEPLRAGCAGGGQRNPYLDVAIPTGLDFARNSIVPQTDAVIALGGGAGTLSEICFAWMYERLIIVLGTDGWAGRMAGERLDDRIRYKDLPEDKIYPGDTPEDALRLLARLLPAYTQRAGLCRESWTSADP
jgi:predicted Rossmann-fold nucleotide-binding protein